MNIRRFALPLSLTVFLVSAVSISGCGTDASRIQAAYDDYTTASAAGDLVAARDALLELVAIDEDVATYWVELGKVQVALGSYSDAYYAFVRALELDRSDEDVLRMLTQISLRSGNLDIANEYARQLGLLVPNDPSVRLTYGIIALRRDDLEGAGRQADLILANQPANGDAKILQAEILQRSGRAEDAIALLSNQLRLRPNDKGSHRALVTVYERIGDRQHVAELRKRIWNLDRGNFDAALDYVEAAFRSDDIAGARSASLSLLNPKARPANISAVLDLWVDYWPGPARVQEARRLAQSAGREQKWSYATFFNTVGTPTDALLLARPEARLPISVRNVWPNAIFAMSLVLTGELDAAKDRLQKILLVDSDNVDALRARARLGLAAKAPSSAINDAQKLVSLMPVSVDDRLLLAQCYEANGDARGARRALWEAFHDIPADDQIYNALRNLLARSGEPESLRKVDQEFAVQKQSMFTKAFA